MDAGSLGSPRHMEVLRRCDFFSMQLQALLRHTQDLEQLLDSLHDASVGSTPSPDVRRRLSIQRVQEEGTAVFNELSERLYTLEVQKADVDQEVRRLQDQVKEQAYSLLVAQQGREHL